ncbi:MAG: exo-beta-N-acetylmuramidase NamZ domain-containing protein [Akkermansiaceae bacterium]
MRTALLLPLSLFLLSPGQSTGQKDSPVFRAEVLKKMDRAIASSIKRKRLPGGVLWLEHGGQVYKKSYGNRSTVPKSEAMTLDTIFDAASLTKVIATLPSVMKLIEEGKIGLEDKVIKYLPELTGDRNKSAITIRHLLTHTSGLLAGIRRGYQWQGYEHGIMLATSEASSDSGGKYYRYSDLNFILLGEIVGRVSKQRVDRFAATHVFEPLKMTDTTFLPAPGLQARIAPTTRMEDGTILRGLVHDPTSRAMGGVTGHAGLFTTAHDLARYAHMLLNGGELEGVRILQPESVKLMRTVQSPEFITARRALGFDIDSPYAGPRGNTFPLGSFGHTGWTGTSLWIDPFSKTFVIFLSNRNHPSGGNVVSLRHQLGTLAAESIIHNFGKVPGALKKLSDEERSEADRKLIPPRGNVLNGIDVLALNNFAELKGLKVGLITNQTGLSRDRQSTIDLLHGSDEVQLLSLFGPEHGIRGTFDGKVADGIDKKTGLPIHSLYAGVDRRKPKREHLDPLDALVFDMQDIGCRFFTYISTMGLAMEATEEAGLKFVVLDRVNPIGGVNVSGPLVVGESTFVAFHDLPLRHGMTVGEIAKLFQSERYPKLELTVVPLRNWKRSLRFDQSGLPWLKPSPNMPNLTAATLYPGLGLLEFTNLSVGRGTKLPFELVGAPYIRAAELAKCLTAAKLPGLQFIPVRFTPEASKFKDEECGGVRILLKDPTTCPSVELGLVLAQALRSLYPHDWNTQGLNTLLRHPITAGAIIEGLSRESVLREWKADLTRFAPRREKHLLYR